MTDAALRAIFARYTPLALVVLVIALVAAWATGNPMFPNW